MNKEEAIKKLKNKSWESDASYGRGLVIHLGDAQKIVSQIDETQRVVIPKFVAEHVEYLKSMGSPMGDVFNRNFIDDDRITKWLLNSPDANDRLGRAWLDGYEIEPEKLYTVEIPNPNSAGGSLVLFKQQSTGRLILDILNPNINKPKYLHLTEDEIKKDFAWAWDAGFAEVVKK